MPRWLGRWLTNAFIGKFAATEPVDAELVTLSSMIGERWRVGFPRRLQATKMRCISLSSHRHAVRCRPHPIPPLIDSLGLRTIDLLKVDVEGSEEAVLRGVSEAHWPRIQQLVLEVENFAAVASITATLTSRGFAVSSYATEREKNPAATSEVSMMYAHRPGYAPGAPVSGPAEAASGPVAKGAAKAAASPARARSASRGRAAPASTSKAAKAASPSPAEARKRR